MIKLQKLAERIDAIRKEWSEHARELAALAHRRSHTQNHSTYYSQDGSYRIRDTGNGHVLEHQDENGNWKGSGSKMSRTRALHAARQLAGAPSLSPGRLQTGEHQLNSLPYPGTMRGA